VDFVIRFIEVKEGEWLRELLGSPSDKVFYLRDISQPQAKHTGNTEEGRERIHQSPPLS